MILSKLKKYKEKNNLSWYRIAKDLNIPYSTIHNWKQGYYKPTRLYRNIIEEYINNNPIDN
jgi:DNA-binding transcriptional regulator YiaG